MELTDKITQEEVYTVSRLNLEARFLLENHFPLLWIEGEISNFAAPNSGHWYFSLKDSNAQVRCAMFRGQQRHLNFLPKDGTHVLIKARVSLYENRGEFQLIAESMEERGEGKLRRAFEALKKKLETAGLFDPLHKKKLPSFPKQIGIITSETGAAIADILTILKRRFPSIPIIVYPTLVQGTLAAPSIVKALKTANRRNECDVIILARGGGSLEDLWAFNEEIVAYAIFESDIPIISGVGHEIDFTIADFVADVRAPTPSAAAEMITSDSNELMVLLKRQKQIILRRMLNQLAAHKQQLSWVHKHLSQQHPKKRLTEKIQQVDFYEMTFVKLLERKLNEQHMQLKNFDLQLHKLMPLKIIASLKNTVHICKHQMNSNIIAKLNQHKIAMANVTAKLNTLSPLATLQRGYAIALNQDHKPIHEATHVKEGDHITVRLMKGELACLVEEIKSFA